MLTPADRCCEYSSSIHRKKTLANSRYLGHGWSATCTYNVGCNYLPMLFIAWLSRRRGIVIACVCPFVCLSIHPSVHLSVCLSVWPWNIPCSHNNSSQIWTGTTQYVPNMHHRILTADIENGGNWPWPLRSFWPLWLLSNYLKNTKDPLCCME